MLLSVQLVQLGKGGVRQTGGIARGKAILLLK